MKLEDTLLERALKELKFLEKNDEFRVRDLFSKVFWKTIPEGIKIKLGANFYKAIMSDYPNILMLRNPGDKIPHRYKLSE